jgi:hypothetical protein
MSKTNDASCCDQHRDTPAPRWQLRLLLSMFAPMLRSSKYNRAGMIRFFLHALPVLLLLLLLTAGCERERIVDDGADTTPPLPPTGLLLEAARDGFIFISWIRNRENDLSGYIVYRSEEADSSAFLALDTIPDFYFIDVQRSYDSLYWYRVTAIDRSGNESPPSPAISARSPNRNDPEAPLLLVLNGEHDAGKRLFRLSWSDVEEADLAGFRVYRSPTPFTSADPSLLVAETRKLNFDDSGVADLSRVFYYGVTAMDRGGRESPLSPLASDMISPRPELVSPAADEGVGPFPLLTWLAVEGAREYRVSMSESEFSGEFWSTLLPAGPRDTVTVRFSGLGLAAGNSYYWRISTVTASNGRVNGISDARRLVVRY